MVNNTNFVCKIVRSEQKKLCECCDAQVQTGRLCLENRSIRLCMRCMAELRKLLKRYYAENEETESVGAFTISRKKDGSTSRKIYEININGKTIIAEHEQKLHYLLITVEKYIHRYDNGILPIRGAKKQELRLWRALVQQAKKFEKLKKMIFRVTVRTILLKT